VTLANYYLRHGRDTHHHGIIMEEEIVCSSFISQQQSVAIQYDSRYPQFGNFSCHGMKSSFKMCLPSNQHVIMSILKAFMAWATVGLPARGVAK
jgi:hypothetical protein